MSMNSYRKQMHHLYYQSKKKTTNGFTLIELIVVMAVIGILVLLALPNFVGFSRDANATALMQDAKVVSDAAKEYHSDKGEWPTYLGSTGRKNDIIVPSKIDPYINNLSSDRAVDEFYIYDIHGRVHVAESENYVIDKKGRKIVSNDKDLNAIANGRY